ncbi:HEAT repeat domain-containing protein [Herbaspirillum sp. RTI4]|uniref:HEAT repeat domain-containing protein n=1 Tax=Herbaspirillum sp. RTI4 TaxID=3048640 RepID=UPI002AB53B8F|nr:HEAT repeat domain-containing protein [Herbaspirillum sp. RTI4]MDY7579168.1 HEAT repeat domain-containing protein [Herbaspirillum sp. RTI4]MEA9981253.1 HEAT repeat domain-containing protein [Herbaspirillum sp. RTI4]
MAFIRQPTVAVASSENREQREQDRDVTSLMTQLQDSDPAVRRWAARDLSCAPEATAALVAQLYCETDKSVRQVILTSLTRLGNDIAVAGLVSWLRSEDTEMRNEAIEAMKVLTDEVAPIMSGLLMDDDSDVRIMAINVLESLRHPDVEQWLIEVIERDSVVNVCGTALDLLSELGTVASKDAVLRLRLRFADEAYIQFAANLALKRIGEA